MQTRVLQSKENPFKAEITLGKNMMSVALMSDQEFFNFRSKENHQLDIKFDEEEKCKTAILAAAGAEQAVSLSFVLKAVAAEIDNMIEKQREELESDTAS